MSDNTTTDGAAGGDEPTADAGGHGDAESTDGADGGGGLSDDAALLVSSVVGLLVASGSVWYVGQQGVWFEALQRVRPTVSGGGVGASWVYGVSGETFEIALLNGAIKLIHIADIVLGAFILVLLFIHWAAFHRLAARMQPPAGSEEPSREAAVTDGGER
ncbi:hypothetical protein [Haloparvum sedimenti]|uniref:hypothetical protein n=1 Tax=Haloparvum sedimenti TaxID=1678448 RepID=UPI00071E75C9|nr:hypothetical protein [Haloparvum sedimenti]